MNHLQRIQTLILYLLEPLLQHQFLYPMEVQKDALLTDDSYAVTSMTSHELYLKAIKEMYSNVVIGRLSSIWHSMNIGLQPGLLLP